MSLKNSYRSSLVAQLSNLGFKVGRTRCSRPGTFVSFDKLFRPAETSNHGEIRARGHLSGKPFGRRNNKSRDTQKHAIDTDLRLRLRDPTRSVVSMLHHLDHPRCSPPTDVPFCLFMSSNILAIIVTHIHMLHTDRESKSALCLVVAARVFLKASLTATLTQNEGRRK